MTDPHLEAAERSIGRAEADPRRGRKRNLRRLIRELNARGDRPDLLDRARRALDACP